MARSMKRASPLKLKAELDRSNDLACCRHFIHCIKYAFSKVFFQNSHCKPVDTIFFYKSNASLKQNSTSWGAHNFFYTFIGTTTKSENVNKHIK